MTALISTEQIDQQLAAIAALTAELKARDAVLREQRRQTLRPGQRTPVLLPGEDTEVGWVSMTKPSGGGTVTATVRDEHELLRWVRQHCAHLITDHLNSAAQQVLINCAKEGGWPDMKTGALTPIPGIDVSTSTPSAPQLRVNLEPDAFARVMAANASGRLSLAALTGGEG